jgi:tetratricopeptide (TPR) repeat protein
MAAPTPKQKYTREEVRHLLGISERQIRSWEQQSFVTPVESYKFSDLLALRTLLGLRKNKIPAAKIRRALVALRSRIGEGADPLTELKIYSEGKRIHVQFAGTKMEPVSGQLLLDFDRAEIEKLLSFPRKNGTDEKFEAQKKRREAELWFEKGLELEQTGAPLADIIRAYEQALDLDPASTGALVNLGTVYFNARALRDAERYYRKALEVDPHYALAHFNLGNLFDEKGDRSNALGHYQEALKAHANYADAHYNIALVFQSMGQTMKAVHHWQAYLKIDPNSSWAAIARRELSRLRESAIVGGRRK